MGDAYHCSGTPVSEMTYTVSSGTLNSTIPYHTIHIKLIRFSCCKQIAHHQSQMLDRAGAWSSLLINVENLIVVSPTVSAYVGVSKNMRDAGGLLF